MRPNKSRRNNYKSNNNLAGNVLRILQMLIRSQSCWNCHQFGHTRHHCLEPRRIFCSFCKNPRVQTKDCSCHHRKSSGCHGRTKNQVPKVNPSNVQPEAFIPKENIIVHIPNQENIQTPSESEMDEDVLEIEAETDSLEDIGSD